MQDAAFGVGDANRREETRVLCLLDGRAHHRDEGGVARHRPVNKMQRVGVETWVRGEAEKVELILIIVSIHKAHAYSYHHRHVTMTMTN